MFLAVGLLLGRLAHRLGLPVLVGELLGGILLGPTVFGRFAPEALARLVPPAGATATARNAFIHLGLLCFLFAAGLEVNVAKLFVALVVMAVVTSMIGGPAMKRLLVSSPRSDG